MADKRNPANKPGKANLTPKVTAQNKEKGSHATKEATDDCIDMTAPMDSGAVQGDGGGGVKQNSGKFKPDFRVAGLSLAGFAGLLIGLVAMSYGGLRWPLQSSISAFHEVDYSQRKVAGDAVSFLDDSMHTILGDLKERLEKNTKTSKILPASDLTKAASDSILKLTPLVDDAKKTIALLDGYVAEIQDAGLTDTVVYKKINGWLHFSIISDNPRHWDDEFTTAKYEWLTKVNGWMRVPGPGSSAIIHPVSTNLNIATFPTNAQFMAKYPQVGAWVLLIAVFCGFCGIALVTAFMVRLEVYQLFEKYIDGATKSKFLFAWFGIVIGLLILNSILKYSFDDELPIKSLYFMRTFTWSIRIVNFIGYFTGACCLAGFIHTASMLPHFVKCINIREYSIEKQRGAVKDLGLDTKSISGSDVHPEQTKLKKLEDAQEDVRSNFDRLVGYFNKYFVLSAVILSLMVLCTGALYGTVNSLSFVRLLSATWGYSPAGSDSVYLYGGLYTVVLLLIYLPVKMRFSEIQLELPPPASGSGPQPAANNSTGLADLVKDPFSKLQGTLVAASPLLVSVVASLFKLLFGN